MIVSSYLYVFYKPWEVRHGTAIVLREVIKAHGQPAENQVLMSGMKSN